MIHGFVDPIPMGVLEVEPRKITIEGEHAAGAQVPVAIAITNTGDAAMEIHDIIQKKQKVTLYDAKASGKIVIKAGETKTMTVHVTKPKPGKLLDYVMIHSNARNVYESGYKVVLVGQFK